MNVGNTGIDIYTIRSFSDILLHNIQGFSLRAVAEYNELLLCVSVLKSNESSSILTFCAPQSAGYLSILTEPVQFDR